MHLQATAGGVERLHIGQVCHRDKGCGKDLGGLLVQVQLPTTELGGRQLVVGRQLRWGLALGESGQRHFSFKLDRIATAGTLGIPDVE